MVREVWAVGDAYEAYVGRWSRQVAGQFIRWLAAPDGQRWLDVGCGTGALSAAILRDADPHEVVGVDPSDAFLGEARRRIADPRVTFHTGDAQALPVPDNHFDAVVSALMLNFVPDPGRAVAEFVRVAAPGARIAAYVWDYADGMAMMRYFWDAAVELDPTATELDEWPRFPLCRPDPLRALWTDAGIDDAHVEPIDVPTVFQDFDDFWNPFLGGQGPAPGYVMSLAEPDRAVLRELLRERLPTGPDGAIPLTARAWAVRGVKPTSGT